MNFKKHFMSLHDTGKKQEGFIALFTAIILSATLIGIAVTLSRTGFLATENVLNMEYKARSRALASSCADTAVFKLTLDRTYPGSETIPIGAGQCSIGLVQFSGGNLIVSAHATVENAATNLQVTLNNATLLVVSRKEVP